MDVHRRVSHAVLHPWLDSLTRRRSTIKEANTWYEKQSDYGATFFHSITRTSPLLPNYMDRPSMSTHIAGNSVKLQFLTGLANKVCRRDGRKLIVFCDWPVTQWLVEMYLHTLGFNVRGIRSAHNTKDREDTVDAFNDPNNPVQILVSSLRISATAVNL